MSYYQNVVFPKMCNIVSNQFRNSKAELLASCSGNVLEIGFGSGLSLPFYSSQVTALTGVEPHDAERHSAKLAKLAAASVFPVNLVGSNAESMPFSDGTFDSAVSIFTLCSVTNPTTTLQEILRVLKPNGKLFFLEHTIDGPGMNRGLQKLLQPVWNKIACGCCLDLDAPDLMRKHQLNLDYKKLGHGGFPNFLSPIYMGVASKSFLS
ncbi:MAG: class I SAM-dependent methyltransferase [Proteobacteria bacterium]|nr:class I SAM-dependent methyltransferase [Pseudomonadota bacterium]